MSKKTTTVKAESVQNFLNKYTLNPISESTPNNNLLATNSGTTITLTNNACFTYSPPPVTLHDGYFIDVETFEIGHLVKFKLKEVGSITKKEYDVELIYKVEKYDDINSKLILQK